MLWCCSSTDVSFVSLFFLFPGRDSPINHLPLGAQLRFHPCRACRDALQRLDFRWSCALDALLCLLLLLWGPGLLAWAEVPAPSVGLRRAQVLLAEWVHFMASSPLGFKVNPELSAFLEDMARVPLGLVSSALPMVAAAEFHLAQLAGGFSLLLAVALTSLLSLLMGMELLVAVACDLVFLFVFFRFALLSCPLLSWPRSLLPQ